VAGDPVSRQLNGVDLTGDGAEPRPGTWINRGDRVLYDSDWVRLVLADVVMPDGTQIDHHVVRMPRPAAGTIVVDDATSSVLLLHRHRFITDTWGWEIPAGAVDVGETPQQAAVREAREESGWEPRSVVPLCAFHPANGVLEQTFHIFVSRDAVDRGGPTDRNEAARIDWIPIVEVRALLAAGEISDGLSFGALSYAFAMHAI
jgi:8-oxo-dGTP pyrophosphatase MutT (NUDIX family)